MEWTTTRTHQFYVTCPYELYSYVHVWFKSSFVISGKIKMEKQPPWSASSASGKSTGIILKPFYFIAGNINHDHGMNNHHDPSVLRHVSTGSTGSFRSSTGSVSSPSTPTNTPLVIPQPVKPPNKCSKTYHCKMCDQVSELSTLTNIPLLTPTVLSVRLSISTNTPLVIPQPVTPSNKWTKTYHGKMCDQVCDIPSGFYVFNSLLHPFTQTSWQPHQSN